MNCPACGSPDTDYGQPSRRQFFACSSYGYGDGTLTDKTELCAARQTLRAIENIVTTEHETKADFIARVRSILAHNEK